MRENIKSGDVYMHFKGSIVTVIGIATHSETMEKMVVYKKDSTGDIWVRPLGMFISEVDHEKYPNVKQKYRFEKVKQ